MKGNPRCLPILFYDAKFPGETIGIVIDYIRIMSKWQLGRVFLFFYRSPHGTHMLSERVLLIGGAPGEILLKLKLFAQFPASPDLFCLPPLLLPDALRGRKNLLRSLSRRKQDTVCIGEYNVCRGRHDVAKSRRRQCGRLARIKSLWTSRIGTVTKDGETDLVKLHRIAMTAPYDYAREPAGLRFEGCQVTDTAFVQPALIIDRQDITGLGIPHGFEEDVHAAGVPRG